MNMKQKWMAREYAIKWLSMPLSLTGLVAAYAIISYLKFDTYNIGMYGLRWNGAHTYAQELAEFSSRTLWPLSKWLLLTVPLDWIFWPYLFRARR